MAIDFQQTDTNANASALAQHCVGGSPTVNSDKESCLCSDGGSAGSTERTVDLSPGSALAVWYEISVDSGVQWNSGTWTIRLNVTTSHPNITWSEAHICRLNSSYVSQGSIGSNTSVSINLGGTGVKSTTVTGSAQTPSAGDLVVVILMFDATGSDSFGWTPDQLISSPFTGPWTLSVSDGLALSAVQLDKVNYHHLEPDTLAIADDFARLVHYLRNPQDTLALSDDFSRLVQYLRNPQDTLALADDIARSLTVLRAFSDTLALGDDINRRATYLRAVASTLALADDATIAKAALEIAVIDTLALADSRARQVDYHRSVSDVLALADDASRSATYLRRVADTLTLADLLTATTPDALVDIFYGALFASQIGPRDQME